MNSSKEPLKAQLHIHTSEDYFDGRHISYSAEGFISLARQYNYTFISITNHDKIFEHSRIVELRDYAAKNGIVYIPGVEKRIQNKDILLYFDYEVNQQAILEQIREFKDIRPLRKSGKIRLVVIPHPFFHFHSMGKLMKQYIDMIDAIEYNWFYTETFQRNPNSFLTALWLNMNTYGMAYAEKYHLPIVANGDLHKLDWFDKDYTLINCEPNLDSFYRTFYNVRDNKVSFDHMKSIINIKTCPLTFPAFKKETAKIIFHLARHYFKHPSHFFSYPFK
ncbi:MAG: PHP domain-containing protein [bacterium]